MSRQIQKHSAPDVFVGFMVPLNADSPIIHVHEQNGGLRLWALVDPKAEIVSRQFIFMPTGEFVEDEWIHRGTAHLDWMVWHLFEIPNFNEEG